MLKDIEEAREALYNIDGPIASPEAMKILNALMAIEVIISQKDEEIIRQRKYIAFLQVCNRTREPWEGTINDFIAKENPHVNP